MIIRGSESEQVKGHLLLAFRDANLPSVTRSFEYMKNMGHIAVKLDFHCLLYWIAIGLALYLYPCQCMMINIKVILKVFGIDLPILVFHSTTLFLNSLSQCFYITLQLIDLL